MENTGFYANHFVIFDFVPKEELQTGRRLEEAILDSIIQEQSESTCVRHRCPNKEDFFIELTMLEEQVRNKGIMPYIHIEGHGTRDYLALLDNTHIDWAELFDKFRCINISCGNNLFFSSGACNSAYSLGKSATIMKASPVFGILAPEKIVLAGNVEDGFTAFYRVLIRTKNLNKAFDAFTQNMNGKNYALIFADQLFKRAAYKYLTEQCKGKGKRQRLETVLSNAVEQKELSDIPIRIIRKKLKEQLEKPQALSLAKFYKKFMLIDKHNLENNERFSFDAVEFERKVKNGKLKFT